ncbi:MAG: deoxynucleoside kinase [Candidatus Izemoplasmataceae bacterium]|uniref:Deoxyguanosine kinase n=1 Tax=Firmicutes bacterium enrichment culture clone fosmid MGS-M1 TaxID=1549348 RepID=A0A0B5KGW2_9FIRM|nr:deoxyguanosine kinase [Firmicutes bacterium enrichment culture clone fosmid MGS-M1]
MRIGIIGPIGSGKSTLAHLLATYYHVPLVKEPVESSPFLPLFYANKEQFALISQNAFYGELFLSMWETKDEPFLICDSTMYSNLVFTELLKKEKIMNDEEVDLTYKIADAHMKLLPDLDIHIVLVRDEDSLFSNVKKRSRVLEKGQYDYLKFHYKNYSEVLSFIFNKYNVPKQKILYLKVDDMFDDLHFNELVRQIEERYQQLSYQQQFFDL